jgi:hypothetical protein
VGPHRESAMHTGEERYEVVLRYLPEEVKEVAKQIRHAEVIPDTVVLVWVRRVGGPWKRATNGATGSRAEGHQKIEEWAMELGSVGPRRSRALFARDLGDIRPWARYLPGLRSAVEDAEAALPQ